MNKLFLFLTALIIFLQFSCTHGFHNRKRVYRIKEIALYTLNRLDLPRASMVDSSFKHPYTIEKEKLVPILSSLECVLQSEYIEVQEKLFSNKEIENVSENLSLAYKNLKENETIVVMTQYDELKSVMSNPYRTSFITWVDSKGINFVFGDIKRDISQSTSRDPREWTTVKPIAFDISEDDALIAKSDAIDYKDVDGFYNKKWIILNLPNDGSTNKEEGTKEEATKEETSKEEVNKADSTDKKEDTAKKPVDSEEAPKE